MVRYNCKSSNIKIIIKDINNKRNEEILKDIWNKEIFNFIVKNSQSIIAKDNQEEKLL
ncbi:hypothetical protein CLPU_1c00350 [Gottschalkia purinilytica]|uniref:Uncharacterized protein n=1 Tax=Gottschalkia purinilytica TaxID=1503 RepID=A0A0L0WEL9_GOTPU|nr:hypothetical protein [Gottschalkia purinilytica]KNF09870.1 hypothetical protein CLPU_1c00350 [Gottschalkia purinilytica]